MYDGPLSTLGKEKVSKEKVSRLGSHQRSRHQMSGEICSKTILTGIQNIHTSHDVCSKFTS